MYKAIHRPPFGVHSSYVSLCHALSRQSSRNKNFPKKGLRIKKRPHQGGKYTNHSIQKRRPPVKTSWVALLFSFLLDCWAVLLAFLVILLVCQVQDRV